MNDIAVTDRQAACAAVAPRVTLADIEAKIVACFYTQGGSGANADQWDALTRETRLALSTLTLCVLVTENGFTIVGKSAPASPANFNVELGRKLAREDAMRQVWAFEGYLLRQRLHDEQVRRHQGEQV